MSIKERIEKAKKLLKKVAVGTALFGLGATAGSCDNKENSGLSSLNEEELKEYANTHKLDTTELYIRDPGATYLSREEYNKQIREFKKEHQIKKSIEAAEDAKISKKEQTSSASKDNKTDDDNMQNSVATISDDKKKKALAYEEAKKFAKLKHMISQNRQNS